MTLKEMKKLLHKLEDADVPEDTQIYTEQERTNETDCFVIARNDEDEVVCVYVSDSSPDTLRMDLEDNGLTSEVIY